MAIFKRNCWLRLRPHKFVEVADVDLGGKRIAIVKCRECLRPHRGSRL